MDYYIEFLLKILTCFLLSSCIGVERQFRGRKAGLRTVILVSLGSFLFVNFSFKFPNSDSTRIAAQVVAGIGFLGAGVIIKDTKNVKGLTTAATLWCSAAIGILCSANLLFEAAVGTLFILFTNIVLRSVNRRINLISGKGIYNVYHFSITCSRKDEDKLLTITKNIITKNKAIIDSTEITNEENDNIKLDIFILDNALKDTLTKELMNELSNKKEVLSISLNKENKKSIYDEEEL